MRHPLTLAARAPATVRRRIDNINMANNHAQRSETHCWQRASNPHELTAHNHAPRKCFHGARLARRTMKNITAASWHGIMRA